MQLPLWVKCMPEIETLLMTRLPPPLLPTVTAWAVLLVPTCCVLKVSAAGVMVATGMFDVAFPVTEIVTLPPELLDAMVRLLVRVPTAVGAKEKTSVQLPPLAANDIPAWQDPVREKSAT